MSRYLPIALLTLSLVLLSACGSSPASLTQRAQTSVALTEIRADRNTQNANATATATLWTATSSPTVTNTPTPSDTPTITNTPSNTPIPSATDTARPSDTPRPSRTPRPTSVNTDTYYVTGSSANVRSCSNTTCGVIATRYLRDEVEVIEQVDGASVAGITRWYHILLSDGRDGYIHSSLVSRTRPSVNSSSSNSSGGSSTGSSTGSSSGSGTGSGSGSSNVQPTQAPPPVTGYTCNCSRTCGQMTCEEAYFQLNQCGCGQRDSDNDGVPCESVCPGG